MQPEFALREDPYAADLFLIGPYDYGADQLRVNGYDFPGLPEKILSETILMHQPEISFVAKALSLEEPTIYFVEHKAFPRRLAAFIGVSCEDPMIALFPRKLLQELVQLKPKAFFNLVRGILVHELGHAYVELKLGGLLISEEAVLDFEAGYLHAQTTDEVTSALAGWRAYVDQFDSR
jgi:hypothetical protein